MAASLAASKTEPGESEPLTIRGGCCKVPDLRTVKTRKANIKFDTKSYKEGSGIGLVTCKEVVNNKD